MRRTFTIAPLLALAALAATSATGCNMIPVKLHTESTIVHADGKVEHKEHDWEGTLDQLPGELAKAGSELADVTAKMAKELTDVPPPGHVALKDLGPGFDKFEGDKDTNFLLVAKNEKGEKEDFEYVKLGIDSYDDFFKTAQELHALTWEATQTTSHIRQFSSRALSEKIDAGANLKVALDRASGANATAKTELTKLGDLSVLLATIVPEMVSKTTHLVQAGEKLVAGAPSALTNPKFATHLGLVKKGLLSSILVVKESGSAMVGLGKDLSPFKKTALAPSPSDPFGLLPEAPKRVLALR
jgi:hypothetical protein